MNQRILPCYPLFVKDPDFSLWSDDELLNKSCPKTWFGESKKIYGFVVADGKKYCFLGNATDFAEQGVIAAEQTEIKVTSFTTEYAFLLGKAVLKVQFMSPLPPDDTELLSLPVCYMKYEITGCQSVELTLFVNGNVAYNDIPQTADKRTVGGSFVFDGYQAAVVGLRRQLPLSNNCDAIGADWGYYYLSGQQAFVATETELKNYLSDGKIAFDGDGDDKYAVSLNNALSGVVMLGRDDVMSVNYFGQIRRGYYLQNHTIADALNYVHANVGKIDAQLSAFDAKLRADVEHKCNGFADEYYNVLVASLRQSVAAHKLVTDESGRLLFLSKECNSNGCMATVDVSYPSIPLYLLYNTELVKGMMRPILDFARMPVWNFDFAPHDAGTYPSCNGQAYGQKKCFENKLGTTFGSGNVSTRFPTYLLPKNADVYDFSLQMPVEECADMLVMFYACVHFDGDKSFFADNIDLARKWVEFLVTNGLYPENQLCTDDFAGHSANNVNLAIKAAVGIACYAESLRATGDVDGANKYRAIADDFAAKIAAFAKVYGHLPIGWDADGSTFSLKYNLLFDKVLGLKLFATDLYEAETDFYLTRLNKYGVPLDNRKQYTKSDWLVWVASLTDDKQKQAKMIASLDKYLREGTDRIPFGDWYETETSEHHYFTARSVQGGCFALLLK